MAFYEITHSRVTLPTLHTGLFLFVISLSPLATSVTSFISLPTYCLPLFICPYFVSLALLTYSYFVLIFTRFQSFLLPPFTLLSLNPFICTSLSYSPLICVPRSNFFLPAFIFKTASRPLLRVAQICDKIYTNKKC